MFPANRAGRQAGIFNHRWARMNTDTEGIFHRSQRRQAGPAPIRGKGSETRIARTKQNLPAVTAEMKEETATLARLKKFPKILNNACKFRQRSMGCSPHRRSGANSRRLLRLIINCECCTHKPNHRPAGGRQWGGAERIQKDFGAGGRPGSGGRSEKRPSGGRHGQKTSSRIGADGRYHATAQWLASHQPDSQGLPRHQGAHAVRAQ